MTLISDNQPSEILKPSEKPLNLPAALISPQHPEFLVFSAATVRSNQLNVVFLQKFLVKGIAVIRFVANKFLRHFLEKKAVKRRFHQLHFMRRSTCKAGGDRKTGSVHNCHNSAPFAPFCPADRLAPF
jgi:hypothetical protein